MYCIFCDVNINSYFFKYVIKLTLYFLGPTIKECQVELIILSEETVSLWTSKKIAQGTMTPDEWKEKDSTICACQKIPVIVLDDEPNVTFKNKSSSTRCKCIKSWNQLKSPKNEQNIENNGFFGKEMIPESTIIAHQRNVSEKHLLKIGTCGTPCDSPHQKNHAYLLRKEYSHGLPIIKSDTSLTSKRVFHRTPLAVVPPEPTMVNEKIIHSHRDTCYINNRLSAPSVKPYQVKISLTDAIKWYSKGEPIPEGQRESFLKDRILLGINTFQENIKPFNDIILPSSTKPVDYFKINVHSTERDYCFERSSCGTSKLVTRRGERHYVNREPCPSCFKGKDNYCVYEFIRQAKLVGITFYTNPRHLKLLLWKYLESLNIKD